MKYSIIGIISLGLIGCTMSVNMVHTEGEATDVVDETQTNEPDVSPELSLPISPLPV